MRSRRPPGGIWIYDPARAFRQSQKSVPPDLLLKVQRQAQELIDSSLKPRHIQPPPEKALVNARSVTTRLFDRASGGAQHCQCGAVTLVYAAVFDWLLAKFPDSSQA